ncbi:glycoside hydrolase domain-containing protein [uncultured Sunxiuqinia sp.]|uniref:glycoside hydrolase domain-containing protein n=1 Tax=uncultured Sunxiuqinia sp. TaxID=1573825 RepID=UPI0026283233|nr:glycoside hydrolase domain-containing protein [uncultured Sunxiuqinia sp.]
MKLRIPIWTIWTTTLILLFTACQPETNSLYSVADRPWEESLGNHRAVVKINQAADAVAMDIVWRRHDRNPDEKQFIIIHESGEKVENIKRIHVDNERCKLVFGPVVKTGTYYFYYLPYIVQEEYGFYNKGYLEPEKNWSDKFDFSALPKAEFEEFQSRTEFDSFYPMEVIAVQSEKDSLLKVYGNDFLVFPEDRLFPIRMLDEIPQRWIKKGPSNNFKGEAQRNEYYTFQLGVFAAQKDLADLKVEFTSLKNGDTELPISKLTCFNTGGVGPYGKPFVKRLDLKQGNVQPLWIGVDIPENIKSGNYRGTVNVIAENAEPQSINISIKITDEIIGDRGDSEAWRHSRLRWLNSTLGIDDQPTKGYNPISVLSDRTYGFTGKTMQVSESGFPGSFKVKETEILNRPISFVVETQKGKENFTAPQNVQLVKNSQGKMIGSWESTSENIKIEGLGTIESDGFINYKLKLKALNTVDAKDIRLELPFKSQVAKYMMGMDLPGTTVPQQHKAKWNGPHDSFWMGNEEAGIWCELRGGEYHGPLLNLYKPDFPESWYNANKGGFKIKKANGEVNVQVFSGNRKLQKGEEIEFEWSFLITPVKDIDYESQFTDRYYHNGGNPIPSDEDLASGVKIVNLHHANNYNPHINYPFVAVDSMKWFVDRMHEKGQKVKIYYTIRELTNYTTELWALRSLGDEILGDGRGGGYPWLREHLVYGYRPQWYQWFPDKSADASVVNAPGDSRWYNYYIEGLKWMVENIDIDGLYLDDVSYDRRTVKRIRKVLDNTKPGCMLDLHSNTGFSKGPATQYAEFFPYLDKLWFGESFHYDEMPPENWFVEVSGIPFGLMGDMLHRGGNRWLGMLYGMTVRHPWMTDGIICDPRPIWKIWDDFGIEEAKMTGFWNSDVPVTTNNQNVKVTVYKKEGKTLLSIGNFSDSTQKVALKIDFKELGINADRATLIAPEIEDFQSAKEWKNGEQISVDARKGWLIYVE